MNDGEFLQAGYLTQLAVLHEWNELKAVMKRYDVPDVPLTGPVSIYVQAEFAIPKRATKAQREAMLADRVQPMKKPDADNILKIVTDPLNGLLWRDDCQITDARVSKFFNNAPRVIVEIEIGEA